MKKLLPIIIIIIIFGLSLLYLHQKIQIHVQAYRLSSNYSYYNELVDKKDYLMYNFTKEISLAKVNQWVQEEGFHPVERDMVLALKVKAEQGINRNRIALFLDRFLGVSTTASAALADEKQ